MSAERLEVGGEHPYTVLVGHGLLDQVAGLLPGAATVALVHPASVGAAAAAMAEHLRADGRTVVDVVVPDGEAAKEVAVAHACWDAFGAATMTRSDAVVGLGGGATTDLAGFVAATWLRGVRVVHVATTLLGAVDAAVGGKTAVNTVAGKNLVGAFHPPTGVLVDLDLLAGVPEADYAAGLAEVVKVGFTHDPVILDLVEADPAGARRPDGRHTVELVRRAVAVKAAVVADDLTEAAGRELLNYGHTLAHAIEKAEHYRWRHGDAVAVGLVYAAELSRLAGRLDEATAARHRSVLAAVGLPTRYRADAWPDLLATMRIDKKSRGSTMRFIALDGLGRASLLEGPDEAMLAQAYLAVAEPGSTR